MNKDVIIGIGIVVIVAVGCFIFDNAVIQQSKINYKDYEANVGKVVIVDKDTLTVINFDTWAGTYTLSNGRIVNKTLIKGK